MRETAEYQRLEATREGQAAWRQWGPYLSERAWGTVREDYSDYGTAWDYFPHDHARSRAYRWNEDGLAGICDDRQQLCFALALWNGRDPILKERLFGLTGHEGNHDEEFTVECPVGSGQQLSLDEVADELSRRLIGLFRRDDAGRRPVFGGNELFQRDPHWRDHLLFYEYFHGDNGAGIGASHQTGWTGLVALLIQQQAERPAPATVPATPQEAMVNG